MSEPKTDFQQQVQTRKIKKTPEQEEKATYKPEKKTGFTQERTKPVILIPLH
jgi:hypothetical protein